MHRQVIHILRQAVQIIAKYKPLHEASVKVQWAEIAGRAGRVLNGFIYNGVGFLIDKASLKVDIHGCGPHGGVSIG